MTQERANDLDAKWNALMEELGMPSEKKVDLNQQRAKDLGLILGDRVVVIPGAPDADDGRFAQYVGYEGIVVGFNESTYNYYYHLDFEDEVARSKYKTSGGVFFNPSCVKKIKHDALAYQLYLRKKEEEERMFKYRWGTCQVCKGPLDMYYGTWCPSCDKPEPLVEQKGAYALIPLLEHMNVVTEDDEFRERVWDYLCERYDYEFRNDSYLEIDLDDDGLSEEFKQIKATWNLNSTVLTWVSW